MKSAVVLFVLLVIFQGEVKIVTSRPAEGASNVSKEEDTSHLSSEEDTSGSSSEEDEVEFTSTEETCIEELHLDKQLITQLIKDKIAPEDNDYLCKIAECNWQKNQWMDSKGKINYDNLLNYFKQKIETELTDESAEYRSLLKMCIADAMTYCESNPPSKGKTYGETAIKTQICILNKLEEMDEEMSELSIKAQTCIVELKLDKKLIKELNDQEIAPENNDDFNKFIECYWQKEEWMNSAGEINYGNLLNSFKENTETELEDKSVEYKLLVKKALADAVEYCENNPPSKGTTYGQTANKILNCILNKLEEIDEEMSELSSKEETCVDELHLDKEHIKKLNDQEIAPENDDDFNKFIECYWQKEEWMNSAGEINYGNLLNSFKENTETELEDKSVEYKLLVKKALADAVEYCENNPPSKGTTYGQTANKILNCILNKLEEIDEEMSELSSKEETCVDELHLDKEHIKKLNDQEIAPENDDDFNKFIECYWQKEEWMNSAGEINYGNLLNSFKENTETELEDKSVEYKLLVKKALADAVEYCENNPPSKGTTYGQTANKILNCILNKLEEMDEEMSELSSKEETCVDELHLDKEHIKKLNDQEIAPENNDDFNKFIECYWQKEEWMDSNGEINYDNLLLSMREITADAFKGETRETKSMVKKKVASVVAYCENNSPKGKNHGQTAVKLQNCIVTKINKSQDIL